jgi:hypothetical protein
LLILTFPEIEIVKQAIANIAIPILQSFGCKPSPSKIRFRKFIIEKQHVERMNIPVPYKSLNDFVRAKYPPRMKNVP